MEIGNRKECLHDYASFPEEIPKQVWAAAQRNPHAKQKNDNQGAKRPLIETPGIG